MASQIITTASAELNPIDLISIEGDRPVTTSLKVAEVFGKRHSHVVEKINSLDCSGQFRSANFSAHPYVHPQNGESYMVYQMTKNGFIFLIMGFTGKKAAGIKESYIAAFDWMADKLLRDQSPETETLDDPQAERLRLLIAQLAMPLSEKERDSMFSRMYGLLRSHFGVKKYRLIPQSRYWEAVAYLQEFQLVAKPAPEQPALPAPDTSPEPECCAAQLPEPLLIDQPINPSLRMAQMGADMPMVSALRDLMTWLEVAQQEHRPVYIENISAAIVDAGVLFKRSARLSEVNRLLKLAGADTVVNVDFQRL